MGLGGRTVNTQYAELLARTKVVVHMNRTPLTRPPRIFDAAACGAAVLANPMPAVSGEYWQPGMHYVTFDEPQDVYAEKEEPWRRFTDGECEQVTAGLELLLDYGEWEPVAQAGKEYVLACHTWERRAVELRGILLDVFPELRVKTETEWMYRP
jgi:hypothetical protein